MYQVGRQFFYFIVLVDHSCSADHSVGLWIYRFNQTSKHKHIAVRSRRNCLLLSQSPSSIVNLTRNASIPSKACETILINCPGDVPAALAHVSNRTISACFNGCMKKMDLYRQGLACWMKKAHFTSESVFAWRWSLKIFGFIWGGAEKPMIRDRLITLLGPCLSIPVLKRS